jgi:hypothetical protein
MRFQNLSGIFIPILIKNATFAFTESENSPYFVIFVLKMNSIYQLVKANEIIRFS